MNEQQMYILIGVPVALTLFGVAANVALFIHLSLRIDTRLLSIDAKLEMLTGKIAEMDTRLAVLEDRRAR